jgi:hypothetical protein
MYISFSDGKFLSLELVLIVIRLTMPKGKTVFAQIMDVNLFKIRSNES